MVTSDQRRANFRRWLDANNIKPYTAATKAGFSVSSIYNFLKGDSETLSTGVLEKLAAAFNASIDEIIGGAVASPDTILVEYVVGARGSLIKATPAERRRVPWPAGLAPGEEVRAAVIRGEALAPLPSGWLVFFRDASEDAADLVGQLAVVRVEARESMLIRSIAHGSDRGLYDLMSWTSGHIEDATVLDAHRVLALAPSTDISSDAQRP